VSRLTELLRAFSDLPGVSGDEGRVREAIWGAVRDHVDAARVDPLGSLLCWKGCAPDGPPPAALLDAHMDEVGLVVTRIDKDGFARFEAVGGLDARLLPGTAVLVGPDAVPGVIGTRPVHLDRDAGRAPDARQLAIDVGPDAGRAVHPGDHAVFATSCEPFGEGLWKGKAFDDRAGCAVLAALLQVDLPLPVCVSFSAQEEVGLRGAGPAAYAAPAEVALAVEGTTCADVPGVEAHGEATRIGAGPVVTAMDGTLIASPRVLRGLEATGVPFQWKRTAAGGTDAGRLHLAGAGRAAGVVAVPCRYIHGPAAVLAESDLVGAYELVLAFLKGLVA
jgi:putative aminopeptidase FrvX